MYRSFLLVLILSCVVHADTLKLKSGSTYEGEVLQQGEDSLTFRLKHGVITIPTASVAGIDKAPPPPIVKPTPTVAGPSGVPAPTHRRIPDWVTVTTALARQSWATNLMQIPATVVDKGSMKYVPYSSYRCGEDFEVNVYGDPDAPCCVEIGVYRKLLTSDKAKANCIALIASVVGNSTDMAIVNGMDRKKDLVVHDGITIEVTPETAEDAYGGWWISIYDEKALDAARATPTELKQITVAKATEASPPSTGTDPTDWQPGDMRYSRGSSYPSGGSSSGGSRVSSGAGGDVYVRGYYRKNGTYVGSHTRSSPGTGGARHR